jgi:hypothetical protein
MNGKKQNKTNLYESHQKASKSARTWGGKGPGGKGNSLETPNIMHYFLYGNFWVAIWAVDPIQKWQLRDWEVYEKSHRPRKTKIGVQDTWKCIGKYPRHAPMPLEELYWKSKENLDIEQPYWETENQFPTRWRLFWIKVIFLTPTTKPK